MKKIYSILFLFSFLIGAIQPVVPLLEYHFFKESIIELLCENRDVPDSDCDGVCYLTNQIEESRESQPNKQIKQTDYYPGTVLTVSHTDILRFPDKKDPFADYLAFGNSTIQFTETPPPRVS